jgi:hypothetical protein
MLNNMRKKNDFDDQLPLSAEDFIALNSDQYFEDFISWFDITGYYHSLMIIGPIISSSKVPSHIMNYFCELRKAYAFGQYRASVALCRTLLEMGLYEKLKRKGVFKKNNSSSTLSLDFREDNLFTLIRKAKEKDILSSSNFEVAHKVRKFSNFILHPKDSLNNLQDIETRRIILDTVRFVEELYR